MQKLYVSGENHCKKPLLKGTWKNVITTFLTNMIHGHL